MLIFIYKNILNHIQSIKEFHKYEYFDLIFLVFVVSSILLSGCSIVLFEFCLDVKVYALLLFVYFIVLFVYFIGLFVYWIELFVYWIELFLCCIRPILERLLSNKLVFYYIFYILVFICG